MFFGLPATLQGFISTLLLTNNALERSSTSLMFQLRHQHAITNSRIIFSNYASSQTFTGEETGFTVQTNNARIPRPISHAAFMDARLNHHEGVTPALDWEDWEVPTPDVSKRSTLHQLAKMAFNAYAPDNSTASEWYDLSEWRSDPHGWGPNDDAMRGHVFVADDNSTVVISIKGTSAGWLVGGGGPTVSKDKKNDNLLFSCCCARVGPTWSTVCGCWDGGYRCDTNCVEDAMKEEGLFYPMGLVSVLSTDIPTIFTPLAESVQQRLIHVPACQYLVDGTFFGRRSGCPHGCHIWCPCCRLRGARGTDGLPPAAPPPSSVF